LGYVSDVNLQRAEVQGIPLEMVIVALCMPKLADLDPLAAAAYKWSKESGEKEL